jgi:hypothetical protein
VSNAAARRRSTLDVEGHTVRLPRPRRAFAVVAVRPTPHTTVAGVYVAYALLVGQTDSLDAAWRKRNKHDAGPGAFVLVVDTETGEDASPPASHVG